MTALDLYTQVGDSLGIARTYGNLVLLERRCNRLGVSYDWQQKAIHPLRKIGMNRDLLVALNNMCDTELELNRIAAAAATLREAYALSVQVDCKISTFQCLFLHSLLAAKVEMWEVAARLLGSAEAVWKSTSYPLDATAEQEYRCHKEHLRAAIGTMALDQAQEAGAHDENVGIRDLRYAVYDCIAKRFPDEPL